MREIKILHITDLHINNPSGNSEHLSKEFYQSYLEEMCFKIKERFSSIDAVIISGDFVDLGKVENFGHASEVIKDLYLKLDINESKVGVCIGNHDIKCVFEGDGVNKTIVNEDRTQFYEFSKKYSNETGHLYKNSRFSISKIGDDILFLNIDSTLGRGGKNVPGIIEESEYNEIVAKLKEFRNTDISLIIIATHYPLVHFYHYPYPPEANWHDQHFWNTGELLRQRINKEIRDTKILWLFGDTHQPAQMKMSNNVYVMSGRFGTSTISSTTSVIPRHAQIIHYKHNNEAEISILHHISVEHTDNTRNGTWEFTQGNSHKLPMYQPELIYDKDAEIHEFENTIIQNILNNDLYNVGRFSINKDEVSLGWVSINHLLNQRDILTQIIKNSVGWIHKKKIQPNNLLIIGVDFWGTIISSNLSLMLGSKNFSCASRGDLKYHVNSVILSETKCKELLSGIEGILIICDVVASGRTIHKIYSSFQKIIDGNQAPKFYAISVISDIRQEKKVNLNFLESFGTFCGNLRIPILKDLDLPPVAVMPTKSYLQ